ncbi:MAG: DnaJ domain [Gammaproteobacteria bacterium]|jgi:hypothetical protein|nr:DnaJ domain [Gammaproteobacteria bacterium]
MALEEKNKEAIDRICQVIPMRERAALPELTLLQVIKILGLNEEQLTAQSAKKAYKACALLVHPDKNKKNDRTEEEQIQIDHAFKVLGKAKEYLNNHPEYFNNHPDPQANEIQRDTINETLKSLHREFNKVSGKNELNTLRKSVLFPFQRYTQAQKQELKKIKSAFVLQVHALAALYPDIDKKIEIYKYYQKSPVIVGHRNAGLWALGKTETQIDIGKEIIRLEGLKKSGMHHDKKKEKTLRIK